MFVGPQIRKLFDDARFKECLIETQFENWEAFENIVRGFLGKNRSENDRQLIQKMMDTFHAIGAYDYCFSVQYI